LPLAARQARDITSSLLDLMSPGGVRLARLTQVNRVDRRCCGEHVVLRRAVSRYRRVCTEIRRERPVPFDQIGRGGVFGVLVCSGGSLGEGVENEIFPLIFQAAIPPGALIET
jgi:hypothetical protein